MFMTGVGLYTLSALLCAAAWSDAILIGARTVQGAATAVMTPAALSLVTTTFPPGPERNKALAIWSMIGGVGATAGLLTGGLITDALGWRWIFAINLPVGLAVLALSPLLLRDGPHRDRVRRFDLGGAATITAAVVALVYAITQVPRAGWASGQTLGLLGAAATLIALFAAVEARSSDPLLPLRVLRSRALVSGNLTMLFAGLAVDGMLFVVTLYAQRVLHYSAVQFGLAVAVMTVASVGGAYAAQHAVTRTGFRPVANVGMVLIAGGFLLLTQVSVAGTFLADLFPGLLVFGLGMGAAFVAGSIGSLTGVDERDAGIASGLQNTSFTLGTALGVAILSTVATNHTDTLVGEDRLPQAAALTAGYQEAFGVAVAVTVLGLVVVSIVSAASIPRPRAGTWRTSRLLTRARRPRASR
jgi:MFS family permease